MDIADFNMHLRTIIESLIRSNYKKTRIGALLLGNSGQTQLRRLLDNNDLGYLSIEKLIKILDTDDKKKEEVIKVLKECGVDRVQLNDLLKDEITDRDITFSQDKLVEVTKSQIEEILRKMNEKGKDTAKIKTNLTINRKELREFFNIHLGYMPIGRIAEVAMNRTEIHLLFLTKDNTKKYGDKLLSEIAYDNNIEFLEKLKEALIVNLNDFEKVTNPKNRGKKSSSYLDEVYKFLDIDDAKLE